METDWTNLAMFREGWMLAVWLTLLGAVFGSFLNVVIHRLPAGLSLIHPGSHCPRCRHAIRWYNNLPVVGWFLLGGKCRDCRAAISPRYPAIEGLVALLFLVVAVATVLPLLPGDQTSPQPPAVTLGVVLVRYGYVMTLLCGLVAAASIRFDAHNLPPRLTWFMLAVGVLVPLVMPEIRTPLGTRADAAIDIALGAVVGLTAAIALAPLVRLADTSAGVTVEIGAGLIWTGIYLGPWAAAIAGLTATALRLAARVLLRRSQLAQSIPWAAYLVAAVLAWTLYVGASWATTGDAPSAERTAPQALRNWHPLDDRYTGGGKPRAARCGFDSPSSTCPPVRRCCV